MTQRKLILLGSIAVLALVYAVQLIIDMRDPVRLHSIPERSSPDTLILSRPGAEPVTLVRDKSGERWRIGENGFPADPMRVNSLLETVSSIRELARVSDGRDYERYGLDETAVTVLEARQGDRLVRRLEAGKAASSWAQTYARIDGKAPVYLVSGSLGSTLNVSASDLRDRQLWRLEATDLTTLEATGTDPGQTYRLERSTDTWRVFTPEGGVHTADPAALASRINAVLNLRAESFAEEIPLPIENRLASFTIRTSDTGYRLFIHERDPEKGYLCTASAWPWAFYLREASVTPLLAGYKGLISQ